jgi:ribose 5-phosphate isomerase A
VRLRDGVPYVTDNGNHVIDCRTGPIKDARSLNNSLRSMPGVLETGCHRLASRALIGAEDGTVTERMRSERRPGGFSREPALTSGV